MRIYGRRAVLQQVAPNTDEVVADIPIPGGCSMKWFRGDCHVVYDGDIDAAGVVAYGLSGFIIPLEDPDSGNSINNLWDEYVPKDADFVAGGFDLDTTVLDTAPEFEPGELDPFALFQNPGFAPEEIYRRRKYHTAGNSGFIHEDAAGTNLVYHVADNFKVHVGSPKAARQDSMAMFGLSSPQMTDTITTAIFMPSEDEWTFLKYAEEVLQMAWMELMGLTSEGTGTLPHDEVLAWMGEILERDVQEVAARANDFLAVAWDVTMFSTFCLWVPGRYSAKSLSSEG